MSFGTPYPYGTAGGDEIVATAQNPPVYRVAQGNSVIVFLHVNGRLAERLRENVEDVVRVLGLTGTVLVAIIVREEGVVRDANASDLDFQDGLTVTQIAPGVVTIEVGTGEITTAMLQDALITSVKIADGQVTLAKMAANSVDASKIVDLSVGTAELANLGVTTGKIANLGVTTAKIADGNVTTDKIADGNVTTAKLASDARGAWVLLSEDDVSAVASFSAPNGVFTSGYEDYVISISAMSLSAIADLALRLRSGGADVVVAGYYNGVMYTGSGGSATAYNPINAGTSWRVMYNGGVAMKELTGDIRISQPGIAIATSFCSVIGVRFVTGGGVHVAGGSYINGSAVDAFTLFPTAGTMTGTIRVYGRKDTP